MKPSAKDSETDALLACTPVDELIAQIRLLVRWIWRLRAWLALGLVAGAGCGALLDATVLRRHTAYAMFSVQTAQHENPLGKFSREAIRFFHAPVNIFPSEALVAKTLERLDGVQPTAMEIYETRRRLDIIDFGRDVYEVSYRHGDPQRAVAFLETHIRVYTEYEIAKNLASLRREADRIKGTLSSVSQRMANAEEKVRAFKAEHADALPEFAQEHMRYLREQEREVSRLEAQAADVEIERKQLAEQLRIEPAIIPVETRELREPLPASPMAAVRLDALRLQLAEHRAAGLRDNHPSIQRLLNEQTLLAGALGDAAAAPAEPAPAPSPGPRPVRGPDRESNSTTVENRPNERRMQMQTRFDALSVSANQLERRLAEAKAQVETARSIVANMPMLEKDYAELSRGRAADLGTYQQVAMVQEMAEFQLKLEQDSAPARLELFNPPRLRFSSHLMKLLVAVAAGAIAGVVLVGMVWGLYNLRRLVWPQGLGTGRMQPDETKQAP